MPKDGYGQIKDRKDIERTLRDLSSFRKHSKALFLILIVLYIIATSYVPVLSGNSRLVFIFGNPVPLSTFTGALSSLSNILIIFLAVFYGRAGYIVALSMLLVQFPLNVFSIIRTGNFASIPGLSINLLTIVAVTLVYLNNKQIGRYQEKVRLQAMTDTLTGLPNRFACMELMDEFVKKDIGFIFVSVDINNFKSINDTMGYEAGNEVLRIIARRWRTLADSWDTGTSDFVARLGGDDFALIIRGSEEQEDIAATINAYKNELEKKITVADCDHFLSACFGYSVYPSDASTGSAMFSCADAAMYEVKKKSAGSNVMRYSSEMVTSENTVETERKIRYALENDLLYINLQPQYDMDHKLRGFEALARIKDQEGNIVSPGEFIPVAEEIGIIDLVDISVFRQAALFLENILKGSDSDLVVSVNISVRHLMKNNFLEEIREILNSYRVPARNFEIEITESIMIESADKALERIDELKRMGIKIAIDDFGTGYSSLSYLNKIPADLLKIDKAFIDEMNNSESSRNYVASIISIGSVFDLKVISEGVETDDQLDTLKIIGCDYIQGYIWGKPMMPDDAARLVVA